MTVLPASQLAAVLRVRLAVARLLAGRLEQAWAARRVRSWARRMSRAGAVVIDTETTDMHGAICEIAVVDASGNVLLDTLVNPGCPIDPAATAVHGITDVDVAEAPPLAEVLPRLLEVTAGRPVLAYNAPYDRDVLLGDAARLGLQLGRLANPATWGCLMRARAVAAGCAWIRLEAGHRALGDAEAARQVLRALAA
jgi:DNA polymerase III epsilon subunit-like protein